MIRIIRLLPILVASVALGQSTQPVAPELGERISGAYDVSFRPFAGAKKIDRQLPSEIMRLTRDDKKWTLAFDRAELAQPIPLKDARDKYGIEQPGYLTAAVNFIKSGDSKADVLRTEVLDTGALRIGTLTAHVRNPDNSHSLLQQAIVEITPRLYYSIVMHSPAPPTINEPTPGMIEAAQMFKAIVDSIEPVDLSKLREDQENRLFRTRALFVEWNKKRLLSAVQPEQFLRFRRKVEGWYEEIGYAYVVEQPAIAIPRAGAADQVVDAQTATGLRVGMRIRSLPEPGRQVDVESWMFTTFDREHEVWKNATVIRQPQAQNEKDREVWFAEVGASDLVRERVFDKDLKPGDFKELDRQDKLPFDVVDRKKLVVRTESRSHVGRPAEMTLPPWYLPQALGTMLPRLLPLDRAAGYLFAGYNSDTRQVMMRYIDVGRETDVTLDGKQYRVIPISDRFGLEGTPTVHYVQPDGKYVGSVNEETGVEVLPTDRNTLLRLWEGRSNINLTQPDAVQEGPRPQ